jgi:hypothetical protein
MNPHIAPRTLVVKRTGEQCSIVEVMTGTIYATAMISATSDVRLIHIQHAIFYECQLVEVFPGGKEVVRASMTLH